LGFFIRKKRKRNANNNLQNIDTGVNDEEKVVGNILLTDKEGENNSKSNSITSISSISSSFRMKKGKVVPDDVNVVADNNNEKEIRRPKIERTPTTISAFTEMVDLTDEENTNLRRSVNSGIHTRFSNVSSSNSSGSAITVQQERIDSIIISPSMIPEASTSASGSGSGLRTVSVARPPPSDTSNNDDNDN